jgi:hypothetical protein
MSKILFKIRTFVNSKVEKYFVHSNNNGKRIYKWQLKHYQEILKVQLPKACFLSFFCYMTWKITDQARSVNETGVNQFTAKSARMEKVESDIAEFERLIEQDNMASKNLRRENQNKKITNQMKYENNKQIENVRINNFEPTSEDQIKIIDEFEDWVNKLREDRSKYDRKKPL